MFLKSYIFSKFGILYPQHVPFPVNYLFLTSTFHTFIHNLKPALLLRPALKGPALNQVQRYNRAHEVYGPGQILNMARIQGTGDIALSEWTLEDSNQHDLALDNICTHIVPGDTFFAFWEDFQSERCSISKHVGVGWAKGVEISDIFPTTNTVQYLDHVCKAEIN